MGLAARLFLPLKIVEVLAQVARRRHVAGERIVIDLCGFCGRRQLASVALALLSRSKMAWLSSADGLCSTATVRASLSLPLLACAISSAV